MQTLQHGHLQPALEAASQEAFDLWKLNMASANHAGPEALSFEKGTHTHAQVLGNQGTEKQISNK